MWLELRRSCIISGIGLSVNVCSEIGERFEHDLWPQSWLELETRVPLGSVHCEVVLLI